MTTAFTSTAQTSASAEVAWKTLIDFATAPRWMDGVDALDADGPVEPGTTLAFTARGKVRPATITEVVPGQRLVIRSVQGPVTADYAYSVQPAPDGGSTIALTADCQVTGPMRLFAPVLRQLLRRTDGGQPQALCDHIGAS